MDKMTERFKEYNNQGRKNSMDTEGILFSNNSIGPTDEELTGLDLEEWKRKRIGLDNNVAIVESYSKSQTDAGAF